MPNFRGKVSLYRLIALVALIALWSLASMYARPNAVPTPWFALSELWGLMHEGKIFDAAKESLGVYLTGLLIAAAIGIPLGLILGGLPVLGRTMEPFVNGFMAIPKVAFIPLIITLLGIRFNAKVTIVVLGAVFLILINTYAGVRNADGELVEMARSAGAKRSQIFARILLPGALPFIVVGLRSAATIGLIFTTLAEYQLAISGLGGLLAFYGNTFQMGKNFAIIIALAIIGVTITTLLRLIENRMDRWRYGAAG